MTTIIPAKQDALNQIVALARANAITHSEIYKALAPPRITAKVGRSDLILKLFAYLGGALIFSGLGVYTEMVWESLNGASRVLITFGPGFIAFVMGLFFASDGRYKKIARPCFVVAFLLEPTGLFVFLNEFFEGGDPAKGAMLVFGVLGLQNALAFTKFRIMPLLAFTLLYALGFIGAAVDFYAIDRGFASLITGLSLFFITVHMTKLEDLKDITWFFFLLSLPIFFSGLYYYIGKTPYDPVALSIIMGLIWFSVTRNIHTVYVLACMFLSAYFLWGPGGGWHDYDWPISNFYNNIAALFCGTSLLLAGQWIKKSNHISVYPVWIFAGMAYALGGAYGMLYDTALEPLFMVFAGLGVYSAIVISSRAALGASILWLVAFIVSFSERHFAHVVSWPIMLIILGFLILGLGFLFARLSGRIKQAAAA